MKPDEETQQNLSAALDKAKQLMASMPRISDDAAHSLNLSGLADAASGYARLADSVSTHLADTLYISNRLADSIDISSVADTVSGYARLANSVSTHMADTLCISNRLADSIDISGLADSFDLSTRLVDSVNVAGLADSINVAGLADSLSLSNRLVDSISFSGLVDSFALSNRLVDGVNAACLADSLSLSNRLVDSVNAAGLADSLSLSNSLVDSVNAAGLAESLSLSNRLVDSVSFSGLADSFSLSNRLADSISFSGRLANSLSMSPNYLIQTWEKPFLVSEYATDLHGGTVQLPVGMDDELWTALGDLGASFQEMLEGAGATLTGHGPDSGRQAAHSMRELIGWTLRTLAPDWAFQSAKLERMGRDGPTRRMRLEWLLRPHTGKKAVERASRQLESTHGALNAIAHSGRGSATHVRGLLRSAEGLLLIIFGRKKPS